MPAISQMYQLWSHSYDWLTPVYLLGWEGWIRRGAVARLNLKPGDTVLDLACGTGKNFPLLLQAIGRQGANATVSVRGVHGRGIGVIGVDYTQAMLDQAAWKVERYGWENITLQQGDAAQLALDEPVDAVLCTFAMSVIPGWFSGP